MDLDFWFEQHFIRNQIHADIYKLVQRGSEGKCDAYMVVISSCDRHLLIFVRIMYSRIQIFRINLGGKKIDLDILDCLGWENLSCSR